MEIGENVSNQTPRHHIDTFEMELIRKQMLSKGSIGHQTSSNNSLIKVEDYKY